MKIGTPKHYIAIFLDWAVTQGCKLDSLLEGTTLSRQEVLQTQGADFVSDSEFATLVANAYRYTNNPAIGIDYGAQLNISSHIPLGHALMNCVDFGQAFSIFLKYNRIVAPAMIVSPVQNDKLFSITLQALHAEGLFPPWFPFEVYFAAIYTSVRFLLQQHDLPFRLTFAYPEPKHSARYFQVFGPEVEFAAQENRLSFPAELLQRNLATPNAALLQLYEQQCQSLLLSVEAVTTWREKVTQLLVQMEGHYPGLEQIAALLAVSPRTLRRRLAEEGTKYSDIMDEVKKEYAIRLLGQTRMSLSSIGFILGYSDVSNFRRAFIKWTGQAPRHYRCN